MVMVMRCSECNSMIVPSMTVCPVCESPVNGALSDGWTDDATVPVRGAEPLVPPSTDLPVASADPYPNPFDPYGVSTAPCTPAQHVDANARTWGVGSAAEPTIDVPALDPVGGYGVSSRGAAGESAVAGAAGSSDAPPKKRTGRNLLAGTSGAMVVLLVAAGIFVWRMTGSASALDVSLVPVGARTEDPFTKPFATVLDADAKKFAARSGAVAGGDKGLYDDWTKPVCDRDALVRMLNRDPMRKAVWAGAMGIGTSAVKSVVASLTPGLLIRDTAVTDHHYEDGRAVGHQSILQRGTAVLRDANGSPSVRCATGDPLTEPTFSPSSPIQTVGEAWQGFTPQQVVHVDASGHTIGGSTHTPASGHGTNNTTIPETDGGTTPLRADTIALNGYLVAGRDGVHVVDEHGTSTPVLTRAVADARDDGDGGLIFQTLRTTDGSTRPDDLTNTVPADTDEAAIWWLPKGETQDKAAPLVESADPKTNWFVTLATGSIGGDRVLVYVDIQRPAGSAVDDESTLGTLKVLDLETHTTTTVGFGGMDRRSQARDMKFVRSVTIADDSLLIGIDRFGSTWYLADAAKAGKVGPAMHVDPDGCHDQTGSDEAVLTDDGEFVTLLPHQGSPGSGPGSGNPFEVRVCDLHSGSEARTIDVDYPTGASGPTWPNEWDTSGDVAIGSFAGNGSGPDDPDVALRIDLQTGATAQIDTSGRVRVLRAPIVIPKPIDDPPGATTTTTPDIAAACTDHDEDDADAPAPSAGEVCGP